MKASDMGAVVGKTASGSGITEAIAKVRLALDDLEMAAGGEMPDESITDGDMAEGEEGDMAEGEGEDAAEMASAAPEGEVPEVEVPEGEMPEDEKTMKARFARKKGMRPKEAATMEDYFSTKGRA